MPEKNAFLPELLLDGSFAKKCRKLSFRKKMHNIDPTCLEQNTIRKFLKKSLPSGAVPVEDNHFGVDYEYKGVTIDQKFSFGALGEDTIKVRIANRELLNNSDWTMIVNKQWEVELFETKKLALFVKKNWGIVQKRLIEKKEEYSCYAVKLDELYRIEAITPLKCEIHYEKLADTLKAILVYTNKQAMKNALEVEKTVIDEHKRVCFEPAIALIAKQFFQQKLNKESTNFLL